MPSGNNRRFESGFFYVFKNMEFFIPSTNPLPWCLFRRDCRFGVMAGAHVTVVSINDLLSFHEEVCEKAKKKKNSQDTDVLVKEDCTHGFVRALGPSLGAPKADRLRYRTKGSHK